jgi:hypothetical protein
MSASTAASSATATASAMDAIACAKSCVVGPTSGGFGDRTVKQWISDRQVKPEYEHISGTPPKFLR